MEDASGLGFPEPQENSLVGSSRLGRMSAGLSDSYQTRLRRLQTKRWAVRFCLAWGAFGWYFPVKESACSHARTDTV